ncbi:hypothetical protein G5B40_18970 [Pikeienuella piscinae]|uniref:Uncharacterized protein n=1 Tax=Pikeienuella piscinae TaxID=2748098 RepID=A0A7M3T5R2_9RHOB|nr:hypothetical protein [Pikeienuella piscinae]QIE57343.1 hypothetical protein G5B40_18970 [Pikeienuella piscinae]
MTRHIIDDRTEQLNASVLKRFGEIEHREAGTLSDRAKILHRQRRETDRSRMRHYARIERGLSA